MGLNMDRFPLLFSLVNWGCDLCNSPLSPCSGGCDFTSSTLHVFRLSPPVLHLSDDVLGAVTSLLRRSTHFVSVLPLFFISLHSARGCDPLSSSIVCCDPETSLCSRPWPISFTWGCGIWCHFYAHVLETVTSIFHLSTHILSLWPLVLIALRMFWRLPTLFFISLPMFLRLWNWFVVTLPMSWRSDLCVQACVVNSSNKCTDILQSGRGLFLTCKKNNLFFRTITHMW